MPSPGRPTRRFARAPLGALLATVLTCAAALLVPNPAVAAVAADQGTLTITSQSATYHRSSRVVTFRIVFNRAPDFSTVDEFGRQADSFQGYVGSEPPFPCCPEDLDSVIVRGEEIHSTGKIVLRNAFPPDDSAGSGGWGTVRRQVPFTLSGRTLRFSAPLRSLTDRTHLIRLPYLLETFHDFGVGTDGGEVRDHIRIHGRRR